MRFIAANRWTSNNPFRTDVFGEDLILLFEPAVTVVTVAPEMEHHAFVEGVEKFGPLDRDIVPEDRDTVMREHEGCEFAVKLRVACGRAFCLAHRAGSQQTALVAAKMKIPAVRMAFHYVGKQFPGKFQRCWVGWTELLIHAGDFGECCISRVKQNVSGIKQHYTPEEMVGKKVMVLVNLKPAKLAGVLSEGMLLCAEDAEGNLALVSPEKPMPAGAEIC